MSDTSTKIYDDSFLACEYAMAEADAGDKHRWNETFINSLTKVNHRLVPIQGWWIIPSNGPIYGPFPRPDGGKPFAYPALIVPKGWKPPERFKPRRK